MSPRVGIDSVILLESFAELADEFGLENVTLAMLAKKFGIRSPSLYNHVKSLNDLRNQLAISGLRQLKAEMTEAVFGKEKEAAITAIANQYVTFARNHPGTYEATIRTPDKGDEEYQHAATEVVKLILNVIHEFGLEDDDAIHAVRGLRSLLHGFASIEQKGGFGMPIDLDGTLQFIINTFLAGLVKKAG